VVVWNWRSIMLLGVSLAIAVGAQFSMVVLIPLALGFLLYVAPVRQRAGLVIWIAASLVEALLLFAMYFFHWHPFAESMRHAAFWGATWRGFAVPPLYQHIAIEIGRACPALALLIPVATVTYLAWPRTRYFGNTAPLLMGIVFIALAIAHPHIAGSGFLVAAIPFLFIFVSGVLADLLETSYRPWVMASVAALLITYVARTLLALAQVPRG